MDHASEWDEVSEKNWRTLFHHSPDPFSHMHAVSPFNRDIAKFITQFIVEEIDENTTMEDLQRMMVVALVYRLLVCVYEVGQIMICFDKGVCITSMYVYFFF